MTDIWLVQIFKLENCHSEPAEGSAVIPVSTTKMMSQFKWRGILGVESGFFRSHTSPKADILFLLSLVEIQMHFLKLSLLWICTQISKDRILVQMGMLKSPAHIFISLFSFSLSSLWNPGHPRNFLNAVIWNIPLKQYLHSYFRLLIPCYPS